MESNKVDLLVSKLLTMGWLLPVAPMAQFLCPDLAAASQTVDADMFLPVEQAVAALRKLLRTKVGAKGHVLDATVQNVILRTMTRRPDLFHDPEKGSFERYMTGVLWIIHQETLREERSSGQGGLTAPPPDVKQQPVPDIVSDRELFALACDWMAEELSPNQCAAIVQKCFVGNDSRVGKPSEAAIVQTRRGHGLHKLRLRARQITTLAGGSRHPRGRSPRSRRVPRGRGVRYARSQASNELRQPAECVMISGIHGADDMARKQQAIDMKNAQALQSLFDRLPATLADRVEVLAAIRERFEREYARHLRGQRNASVQPAPRSPS